MDDYTNSYSTVEDAICACHITTPSSEAIHALPSMIPVATIAKHSYAGVPMAKKLINCGKEPGSLVCQNAFLQYRRYRGSGDSCMEYEQLETQCRQDNINIDSVFNYYEVLDELFKMDNKEEKDLSKLKKLCEEKEVDYDYLKKEYQWSYPFRTIPYNSS